MARLPPFTIHRDDLSFKMELSIQVWSKALDEGGPTQDDWAFHKDLDEIDETARPRKLAPLALLSEAWEAAEQTMKGQIPVQEGCRAVPALRLFITKRRKRMAWRDPVVLEYIMVGEQTEQDPLRTIEVQVGPSAHADKNAHQVLATQWHLGRMPRRADSMRQLAIVKEDYSM